MIVLQAESGQSIRLMYLWVLQKWLNLSRQFSTGWGDPASRKQPGCGMTWRSEVMGGEGSHSTSTALENIKRVINKKMRIKIRESGKISNMIVRQKLIESNCSSDSVLS